MKTLHKRLNALSQSCDSLHLLNIVPKFLHSLLLKRKIDTVLILCIKTCLEIFLGVQGKKNFMKEESRMSDKQMKTLGWVATFMSVMMYVSYVPQIMDNLSGHKGNFIQPLVAAVNCSLWVYYGLFKKERDLPLAAANAPGIIFGLITALTALF